MKQNNGFPIRGLDRFDLEAASEGNAIRRLKSCFAKEEKSFQKAKKTTQPVSKPVVRREEI